MLVSKSTDTEGGNGVSALGVLEGAAARLDAASGLDAKLAAAKAVLGQAMDRYGPDLALAWTGGKDSTLLVWLAREVCRERSTPLPRIVTIDEGDTFPEIEAFLARLSREWGLSPTVIGNAPILARHPAVGEYLPAAELGAANQAVLARIGFTGPGFPFDPDAPLGCQLMKTAPLTDFLETQHVGALAVAIRRDEHPARATETVCSPRTAPPHLRLHPLLPFRERDVWDATFRYAIPFCALYEQGYRSLGTRSGSHPAAPLPAWEQDLEHTPERVGRAADKEQAMTWLRSLGYM